MVGFVVVWLVGFYNYFVCVKTCMAVRGYFLGVGLVLSSILWVSGTEGLVASTFPWFVIPEAPPPILMEYARMLLAL